MNFEERIGFRENKSEISIGKSRNKHGSWGKLLKFGKNKKNFSPCFQGQRTPNSSQ